MPTDAESPSTPPAAAPPGSAAAGPADARAAETGSGVRESLAGALPEGLPVPPAPADIPADTPADNQAHTPADTPARTPTDIPADTPADAGGDAPTDTLVREPQQERSRKTLLRLVNAGLALLQADGPEAVTVTGVTRRARTSVGSFYARFQGKEDFLRYLGEGALEEAMAAWGEARVGLPAAGGAAGERVEPAVRALGDLYLDGAGRRIALMDGVDDPHPTRRSRLEDFLAAELGALLEVSERKASLAARVAARILCEAAAALEPTPGLKPGAPDGSPSDGEGTPIPDREILLSELVELLSGYLDPARERPAASGPEDPLAAPDPFDVWG